MGLHSIIEPAGTLLTGWELAPDRGGRSIDVRNADSGATPDPSADDRTPPTTASKWEQPAPEPAREPPDPGSGRQLREVRQRRVAQAAPHL